MFFVECKYCGIALFIDESFTVGCKGFDRKGHAGFNEGCRLVAVVRDRGWGMDFIETKAVTAQISDGMESAGSDRLCDDFANVADGLTDMDALFRFQKGGFCS